MNKALLTGRVGQDAELQAVNDTHVAKWSVATTEKWKDKDGNQNESTEWHRCVMWGKRAQAVAQYIQKGTLLMVEGKITTRSWDDKETGQKRYATEINVNNVEFLAKPGKNGGGSSQQKQQPPQQQQQNFGDDDIPF